MRALNFFFFFFPKQILRKYFPINRHVLSYNNKYINVYFFYTFFFMYLGGYWAFGRYNKCVIMQVRFLKCILKGNTIAHYKITLLHFSLQFGRFFGLLHNFLPHTFECSSFIIESNNKVYIYNICVKNERKFLLCGLIRMLLEKNLITRSELTNFLFGSMIFCFFFHIVEIFPNLAEYYFILLQKKN